MAVLDFDWRRLMRWTLLGSVVMALWMCAPMGRCSWKAFRDEPLDEAYPLSDTPGSHKQEIVEGDGFFARWGGAIKTCYARTPPLKQEKWKRNVLFGLLGATALFWGISTFERRRKRTYSA